MQLTEQEQRARKKLCLALDNFYDVKAIKQCLAELSPLVGMFKIGKELFTRFGPDAVKLVHDFGAEVFLDLKYHDIPNTVKGATYAATQLGVYLLNVHASGGLKMMQAALEGAKEASAAHHLRLPKIIGVTVLTSIDQQTLHTDLQIPGQLETHVLHLAQLAQQAGLDGIVCSATDLQGIRKHLPPDVLYVTPGIKGPNTAAGKDQQRVFTPRQAIQAGASILVVGRAITMAPDRVAAACEILQDMVNAEK